MTLLTTTREHISILFIIDYRDQKIIFRVDKITFIKNDTNTIIILLIFLVDFKKTKFRQCPLLEQNEKCAIAVPSAGFCDLAHT